MEAAAGASAGATPQVPVPVDKSSLKKELRQLIVTNGPILAGFTGRSQSANAETASNSPDEKTESEVALFELMLDFTAALMEKDYGEALRFGQEVVKYEPVKKSIQEFIPVLEQLTDLSAAGGDVESESDSSQSGSDSSSDSDSSDDSGPDSGDDDGEDGRSLDEQVEDLVALFNANV